MHMDHETDKDGKRHYLQIRISAELKKKLARQAVAESTTLTELVTRLIRKHVTKGD